MLDTSAWLYKLATYVCHSCESRNPEKPKKILDSRLIPAGMTNIELMQLSTSMTEMKTNEQNI